MRETKFNSKGGETMRKRMITLLLALVMCLSLATPVMAEDASTLRKSNDYISYTIDLSTNSPACFSSAYQTPIQRAREFVSSLNLSDEYSYIKDVALQELASYEASQVELYSYTVYVPTSASSESVYGTYNGRTFYYSKTTGSNLRIDSFRDVIKSNASSTTWTQFTKGFLDFVLCFADWKYSIPYAVFTNILTNAGDQTCMIHDNDYVVLTCNGDTETRTIYTYDNNNRKKIVKVDQTGIVDFFVSYAPVGRGFSDAFFTIDNNLRNINIATPNYYKPSTILPQCLANYNHQSTSYSYLSSMNPFHVYE